MTIMYKLTTKFQTTYGGMKWEIGKTNRATGNSSKMCTDGLLHCYADPHLAVMFNPVHANISEALLFKVECSTILDSDGMKYGCKEQTPKELLTLPVLSTEQRVAFGIKCALLVLREDWFVKWAEDWLSGVCRGESAALSAARRAAWSAAYSAACSAVDSAATAESMREIMAWVLENIN
jgi:hypothetical protein